MVQFPVAQLEERRRDAGLLPLEKGRAHEFEKHSGLGLAQQTVTQAKQGISLLFHAVVDLLVKRFQCIKVHLEFAPGVFVLPGTVLHPAIFCNRELPEFTFV
jgi:hypothetical protein